MLELILLGLASWFIPIHLGTGSLILPIAVGLAVGLFTRGSVSRLVGSVFSLLAAVLPASFYALSTNWTASPAAMLFGGKLFIGYLAGTLVHIVFTPFRWMGSLFKRTGK